jgi:hypothetical protein
MEQIKICKGEELYGDIYGSAKSKWVYYGVFPIIILFSLLGCKLALDDGMVLMFALCLFVFLACAGFLLYTIFGKESVYKPQKSFGTIRGSNERILKIIIIISIISIILVCSVCYIFYAEATSKSWLSYAVSGIIGLVLFIYYTFKSFKVHEDVDYVTSSELENIVGVEIGERIQATYQNYNSSINGEYQDNSNLMVVSDKRVFFSFIEEGKWSFTKKNICDIVKIGIFDDSYNNQKIHFKLVFSDDTSILLHMESYGKATSNTLLFLRKFLDVLDAVILGTVDEKITSRRRVSVNQETKPIESQKSENKEVRRLDLSEDMIEKLRNATPVESGRVLEF